MKILMVCLGNICRSPIAEGILRHKASRAGLRWTIDSAGTGGWHAGQPPHHLSQKVALLHGIDIGGQRARQFVPEDCHYFDRLYFMDSDNLADARHLAGRHWIPEKAMLLLHELQPGTTKGVPDPYYGTEPDYHEVFQLISRACDAIINRYANSKA
jgi:protein-tyrosine phosphatase